MALLFLWVSSASGQEPLDPLSRVVELYNQGNYREAADSARSRLAGQPELGNDAREQLLIYLAFSLVALGQEAEAEDSFMELIRLDPRLELNPEFVSPKIIDVFRRAKTKTAPSQTNAPPAPLLKRSRPAKVQVFWRSLLWPGWGQRHRGSRLKGSILQGSSLGAAAGWAVLELGTRQARTNYLESTDPLEIEKKYRTYNNWYRARNFAVNLVAAIWLYNVVDVLIAD